MPIAEFRMRRVDIHTGAESLVEAEGNLKRFSVGGRLLVCAIPDGPARWRGLMHVRTARWIVTPHDLERKVADVKGIGLMDALRACIDDNVELFGADTILQHLDRAEVINP
jgi:hypothetical protein